MENEPSIIINGIKLSDGAAMTIRVALESFWLDLNANGLGNDDHGKKMVIAYKGQINQIRELIFKR